MRERPHAPVKIHRGPASLARLDAYLEARKALLLCSPGALRRRAPDAVMAAAPRADWTVRTVTPNPDLRHMDAMAADLRREGVEVLVALGGGSVMDSAKALATVLAAEEGWSLAEHLRRDAQPVSRALPFFCVPTTAGTGAEVTPFATMWDREQDCKRSLAHGGLFARAAFLLPELTLSLPWTETLWGALDSISHSMETLWNKKATNSSLACARASLTISLKSLPEGEAVLESLGLRRNLQQAALLAGLAISRGRTAVAHSMSYPLTLRFGVPHGLACAFTIPAIVKLISAGNLWRQPGDAQLGEAIARLFAALGVAGHMLAYCDFEEARAVAHNMYTENRAGNFVLPVTGDLILDLLHESLAPARMPAASGARPVAAAVHSVYKK